MTEADNIYLWDLGQRFSQPFGMAGARRLRCSGQRCEDTVDILGNCIMRRDPLIGKTARDYGL